MCIYEMDSFYIFKKKEICSIKGDPIQISLNGSILKVIKSSFEILIYNVKW